MAAWKNGSAKSKSKPVVGRSPLGVGCPYGEPIHHGSVEARHVDVTDDIRRQDATGQLA
jgi:hypothetical protein